MLISKTNEEKNAAREKLKLFLLKIKDREYYQFIFTLVIFLFSLGQKTPIYGQLQFVSMEDSCVLQFCTGKHNTIQTNAYKGACSKLQKDTLALIELLLTHYDKTITNSCDLLTNYISGETVALAAPEGFANRSSLFASWYYTYKILFLAQSASSATVYIKDCRLGISSRKEKITDTFFENDAMSRYKTTTKFRKIHSRKIRTIHKLYQKWLKTIKRLGLSTARQKNIHPFKCSPFRWN